MGHFFIMTAFVPDTLCAPISLSIELLKMLETGEVPSKDPRSICLLLHKAK